MRLIRAHARGYTVVELLMAMAVFAIGVTGIAAMQKITLASNLHAKRLAIATHIAQSWQEQLAADGALWQSTTQNPANTQWLSNLGGGWIQAPANSTGTFGPSFGPLGDFTSNVSESYFCVQLRLTDMSPAGTAIAGNGLIRSEVLVFWPRDGREPIGGYCNASASITLGAQSFVNFHFVHKVSAVRQST